ncbi:protein stum [Drosophila albomicans]|uniref:Protein stum n=1 Tax=Drosophila albomicans TaxID=7291 RepID=A0A9C6SXY4_DROAB|nr:protein stum [Drosophila albomicans]
MQQTLSYSSSPSPTLISTITHPVRSTPSRPHSTDTSTTTTKPAIISVDYSYDPKSIMSPSAQHSNANYGRNRENSEGISPEVLYMEREKSSTSNQPYSSLFGDPVPPPQPEDYFGTAAFETIRAGSVDMPSSEEDTLIAAVALNTLIGSDGRRRLFSNVPYTNISNSRVPTLSHLETPTPTLTPTPTQSILPLPRLQPPDIQILPNSSGGSSSEHLDSPNFMLLTPQDIVNKPDVFELEYEQLESTMGSTYTTREQEPPRHLRPISGSYSSTGLDWYRREPSQFAEFSRIPKLRPSSKMIMSMKHEEMPLSPLATMLQDSNGSSSGGEEPLVPPHAVELPMPLKSPVPNRSDTIPTPVMDMDIILSPKQYLQQQQREIMRDASERQRRESYNTSYGPDTPQSPSLIHSQFAESGNNMNMMQDDQGSRVQSIAGEMSPVVFKDSVATGGDYRVGETRLHKKSSFTILSVRSPKSSLTHSPSTTPVAQRRLRTPAGRHASIQSTTTSSIAVPPPVRARRKSLTGSRLPQLPPLSNQQAADDSPRPSVQFNMSGRYSPSKLAMPTKGILQQRDSLTSSVDTYTPRVQRRGSINNKESSQGLSELFGQRIKSMETLPLITDPYRSGIPRFHRSAMELDKETAIIPPGSLPRPLKPNPNPTRKQRGLLGVVNRQDDYTRNPPRSNWLSLDDLIVGTRLPKSSMEPMRMQARRRSSSTSPERRSSTQTASDRRSSNLSSITTSDFSFRRPSLSTLPSTIQRRKSIYLPGAKMTASPRRQIITNRDLKQHNKRTKIAKPSTLSPIIGTPNKDIPQSPLHGDAYEAAHMDTASELSARRDSISRIPVRSRRNSVSNSRSNSPLKDFSSSHILSGRNSQASNSRSPSQATNRSGLDTHGLGITDIRLTPTRFNASRPTSRGPPSRPESRMADTNDMSINSRANSRSNSRANSRANSQANSRANSRLSVRSSLRSTSLSPATMSRNSRKSDTTPNRRKSISISPKSGMLGRRMSLSPAGKQGKPISKKDHKETIFASQRRNSRSRIPTSINQNGRKSASPSKKAEERGKTEKSKSPRSPKGKKITTTSTKSSPREKSTKSESAKKKTSLISKPETSVKRTVSKTLPAMPAKKPQTSSQPKTPISQKQKTESKQAKNGEKSTKSIIKTNGANGSSGLPKPLARTGSQMNTKKATTESPEKKVKQKESPEKAEHAKDSAADSSQPLAVHVGNAVLQAAEALPAVRNEVNASTTGGIKRQGSNMSTLVRMSSRLSLVSNKKRVDSAQNRKVATVPEQTQETEVPKGHAAQLATTGQLTSGDGGSGQTATSSSNSQKTLKSETHKTINENLTDPKSQETEAGLAPEIGNSPSPNGLTATAKPHDSISRLDTADGSHAQNSSAEMHKSPLPPTQPIEASISVLNATETDSATTLVGGQPVTVKPEIDSERPNVQADLTDDFKRATPPPGEDFQVDDKRLSPDGQGSTAGSGGIFEMLTKKKKNSVIFSIDLPQNSLIDADKYLFRSSSQEFIKDDIKKGGICRCCTTLCMRFRRSHCMRCCGRRQDRLNGSVEEQPVLSSARSSATTTHMEIVDETKSNKKKSRCWPMSNCCKSCRKKSTACEIVEKETKASTMSAEPMHQSGAMQRPQQQGKCGLCLRKIFCCRSVNKVDPVTGDETELRKCCFCIPCRRKRGVGNRTEPKVAWRDRDPELGITASDAAIVEGSSMAPSTTGPTEDTTKMSCCRRFWLALLCCRKKPRRGSDARRQSIKAPPPSEDTRRKLHNDLVEYTSKMKGAIPVLPLYLAWFCAFCNVIFPGLGTLLSGLFCLCVGIPRFSQYDSARARIGSFIINIIVAVSQFFCVLFCFVGWGWSIWWGAIMLRCAKKLSKIKKVERLELEEEQRQAELAAAQDAHRGETEAAKT